MCWHWWATRPWGDWATWAGAIGTVLAFLVAFSQLKKESAARTKEITERNTRENQDQATKVTAWMGSVHFEGEDPQQGSSKDVPQGDVPQGDVPQGVLIQNSSDQAIFSVAITRYARTDVKQSLDDAKKTMVFIRSVPPGIWYTEGIEGYTSGDRNAVLPVEFVDCRANGWKRERDGKLEMLKESEWPEHGPSIPVVNIRRIGPRDYIA